MKTFGLLFANAANVIGIAVTLVFQQVFNEQFKLFIKRRLWFGMKFQDLFGVKESLVPEFCRCKVEQFLLDQFRVAKVLLVRCV